MPKPMIVCLCGSTRFYEEFQQKNFELTLKGVIVLSIGCNTKSDDGLSITDEQKVKLDELHLRKIDLADGIFVLNKDGYIGESTKREICYAMAHHKDIQFLDPTEGNTYMLANSHALGRIIAGFALGKTHADAIAQPPPPEE